MTALIEKKKQNREKVEMLIETKPNFVQSQPHTNTILDTVDVNNILNS